MDNYRRALKRTQSSARVPVPNSHSKRLWNVLAPVTLLCSCYATTLQGQTVEDEFVLRNREFLAGLTYSHDSWDQYWEGARNRVNGNIGTITTQTALWTVAYGITDRLNLIGAVPYVWTHASQGVLTDMEDFQDVTIAGKYRLLETPLAGIASLRTMAVVAGSIPLSNYTPDFLPLSIGTASRRLAGRLTANLRGDQGWFINGSVAYTWRDNIRLDRPYYFTQDQLFFTNEVDMPNVFEYATGVGYARPGMMGSLLLSEQRTRGGGDIRRQDMPFVSNRMDFSKLGVMVTYSPSKLRRLEFRLAYAYTVEGRNVGQATTVTIGVTYRSDITGRQSQ